MSHETLPERWCVFLWGDSARFHLNEVKQLTFVLTTTLRNVLCELALESSWPFLFSLCECCKRSSLWTSLVADTSCWYFIHIYLSLALVRLCPVRHVCLNFHCAFSLFHLWLLLATPLCNYILSFDLASLSLSVPQLDSQYVSRL